MSAAVKVSFEIDGQTVAARDAVWFQKAPCGCLNGVSLVWTGDDRHDMCLTEAEAWTHFGGNAEQQRRDIAAGFTVFLGRRSEVKSLVLDCTHHPKWGVHEAPVPDGFAWATAARYPSGSARQHLAPTASITVDQGRPDFHAPEVAALCGRKNYAWFSSVWTDDVPTCRRCEAKAERRDGGAS